MKDYNVDLEKLIESKFNYLSINQEKTFVMFIAKKNVLYFQY